MRKDRGIRVSEKHGVNPSIAVCWYCGDDTGELILPDKLAGDAESPRRAVWHKEPCPKCQDHMRQGVILIGVNREPRKGEEPDRSGHFLVVREEWVRRSITSPELVVDILRKRMAFIPAELARMMLEQSQKV